MMRFQQVLLLVFLAALHCECVLIRTARSQASGTTVTVSGIVTVPTGQFGDGGFAVRDFSGGIYVSAPSTGTNPSVTVGKAVDVTGVLRVVNGLISITPTAVSVGSAVEPEFVCPSLNVDVGPSNQGRLLSVSGQVVDAVVSERNGKKFTLSDSSGNLKVFVPSSTGINLSALAPGYGLRVVGLSSAYNNVPEVVPRFASDFVVVSAAPLPSPSPSRTPAASASRSPTPSPSRSPAPSASRSPIPSASRSPAPSVAPPVPPSGGLAAIYGVVTPVGAGSGPTLYVSTTGVDTAAGTISAPLRTLAAAVSKVRPGGTIIMRAGTYQGAVINTGWGNATAWVTLKAYDGEAVVLQGNPRGTSVATIYFYHSSCDEYAPAGSVCVSAYWRIIGLKIMGAAGGGADSNAVKIDTPHVQVINSTLCCSVPDVVKIVRTANDAVIMGSEIFANPSVVQYGANSQGIDITGADRVRVLGNYFHDLPDIAAYAKGNARNAIFAHNRITHTGYGGSDTGYNAIMLGQQTDENRLVDGPYESYDGLVVNNIISDVTGACIAASSSYNPRFYHNTCYRTSQTIHAAILVSTEGGLSYTPNKGAEFVNNIFVQNATRPRMIRSTDREYTKPTEAPLIIQNNIYWASGATPSFVWIPAFYNDKPFADWQTAYSQLYGQTDTSRIVDPLLTSELKLGASSPAIATARAGLVSVDFNLKPRPAQPSLGAFEP